MTWPGSCLLTSGELWAPNSSDSIVLVDVILERKLPALIGLWLVGAGLVALALFLARGYGAAIFAPLGLSEPVGRRLALSWTAWVAVTALPGKLPLPGRLDSAVAALIAIPLMAIGPVWLLARLTRQEEAKPRAPGYAWLGTLTVLALILFGLVTRSGCVIRGDPDMLHLQVIQAHYCERVDCVPQDVMRWLR